MSRSIGTHRRTGNTYIVVLSATMMLTVIGLSALMVTRVRWRGAEGENHFSQARLAARSAIEIGLDHLGTDQGWRETFTSGVWVSNRSLGAASYTLSGTDPDGDLADNEVDPLVLKGTGLVGDARYMLQVSLSAEVPPLTCLEVAWHAGNDIVFDPSSEIHCDQTISGNDTVQTSGAVIVEADVEAVNTISGSGYLQNTTTGITPRTMPDPATVFDDYLANGTVISITALPLNAGSRVLEKQLISPAVNPYGSPNAEGIYVIDCLGAVLHIQDSRIVGTLVILDPGPGSKVTGAIHWAPARADYPSLLVSGTFEFSHSAANPLDENALGVNFNPAGTPFGGVENSDQNDPPYPTIIKGLIYASGDIFMSMDPAFKGVVISGNSFFQSGNATVTYQSTYLSNPPPGFTGPANMSIDRGSWKQVVE